MCRKLSVTLQFSVGHDKKGTGPRTSRCFLCTETAPEDLEIARSGFVWNLSTLQLWWTCGVATFFWHPGREITVSAPDKLWIFFKRINYLWNFVLCGSWTGIAQSVYRLATGWTVQRSNPDGCEIFRSRPDRPWGPPSHLYDGYRVFPRTEVAGAWRWLPTPFSAEVKERVELYLYFHSGVRGPL